MRKYMSCSFCWRFLLVVFFVLLMMKQGTLPVVAQAPPPTPATTATTSAPKDKVTTEGQEEPAVDISLNDIAFLLALLKRAPFLLTFSFTLALFLSAFILAVMPLSLWNRLIGLPSPLAREEMPLTGAEVATSGAQTEQVVTVQQASPGTRSPRVIEQQPRGEGPQITPSASDTTAPPQGRQVGSRTSASQQEQARPQPRQSQQEQTEEAGAPQQEDSPSQASRAQSAQAGSQQQAQAPGQPAPETQQPEQPSQQESQQQQGRQIGPAPPSQTDQRDLQDLLRNQTEEEEGDIADVDEEIQNILTGVFGEDEGIDPRLEFLATLVEDVDIEELEETLQEITRLLQRRKRR